MLLETELEKRINEAVDAKVGQLRAEFAVKHEELARRLEDVEHRAGGVTTGLRVGSKSALERPALASQDENGLGQHPGLQVVSSFPSSRPPSASGDVQVHDFGDEDAMDCSESRRVNELDFKKLHTDAVQDLLCFTLEESVWDSILFVHADGISTRQTVLIVFCLLVNLIWQISFCMILAGSDSFVKDPYPDLPTVEKWRLTTAHDIANMDTVTRTSLASRVCNRDGSLSVSTSVMSMYSEIGEYLLDLGFFKAGPGLCVMVLLLWGLFIFQELLLVFRFVEAVLNLPRVTGRSQLMIQDGSYIMANVGCSNLPMILLSASLRACIAVLYGWYGGNWLANTKSVEALVLNAAALCFVLDMDELIFTLLIPVMVQHLVKNLKPLKRIGSKLVGLHIPFIIVAVTVYTGSMYFGVVHPKMTRLKTMNDTICDGNLDFVFGIRTHTGEVLTSSSAEFLGSELRNPVSRFQMDAVREMVRTSDFTSLTLSDSVEPVRMLAEYLQQPMSETTHDWATCDDVAFSNTSMPHHDAVLRAMKGGTQDPLACRNFTHLCTDPHAKFIRLLCPTACGCADPHSGLFFNTLAGGCPRNKCVYSDVYLTALARIPCEDPSAAVLANDPGWNAYWNQMSEAFRLQRSVAHLADLVPAAARQYGCGLLNMSMAGIQFIHFCHGDHLAGASLRPWCPITCVCTSSTSECPPSCPVGVASAQGGHAGHAGHGSSGSMSHGSHTGTGGSTSGHGSHAGHGSHGSMSNSSNGSMDGHSGHGDMDNSTGASMGGHSGHATIANSSGHVGHTGMGNSTNGSMDGHSGHSGMMGNSTNMSMGGHGAHAGMTNGSGSSGMHAGGHGGMDNSSMGSMNHSGHNASDPMANMSNSSGGGSHSSMR